MNLKDVVSYIKENREKLIAKAIEDMFFPSKVDENMPEDGVLLDFPEGQKHKNIRIVNLGKGEEK